MADELKRCPFCGASAAWLTELGFMECGACTATGTADGAEGWNRRPIEDALRAERDAALARAEAAERRLRITAGLIIEAIGSVGPEDAEDAARRLGDVAVERDAAVARAEAAEGLIGRRGAIKVTGNRNDGWRGDLVDPDDNGCWFRTAGYDSRDAVVVTLFHWAVVNDVAVVG